MISLVSYPSTLSRVYAVHNPLNYTFLSTARGAGAFNVYEFNCGPAASNFFIIKPNQATLLRVGDVITVNGIMTNIEKITELNPGASEVIVSPNHNISSSNVVVKSVNNYRAEFRIFHGRKETDSLGNQVMKQVGPTKEATPSATGSIKLNVQPYLKPFIRPDKNLSSTRKNTIDTGLWGRFFVQWRERFDGDDFNTEDNWAPATPTAANMRWYISAVRQYFAESVSMYPFVRTVGPGVVEGEFLSAFNYPTYIQGVPNEISFMWFNGLNTEFLRVKEQKLNNSKSAFDSPAITPLLTDGREEINRIRLGSYTHDGFITVTVEETTGSEGYVQPGYVLEGYFE
jgi:hypothetical protein